MSILALITGALLFAEPAATAGLDALVVVNQPQRTLQRVAIPSGEVSFTARMGDRPHEVAISPDGQFAVVPIYGDGAVGRPGTDGSSLELVELATGAVKAVPLAGAGLRPHDVRFGPDGLVYVTAELLQAVLVIDPRIFAVVAQIPTGREQSHSLAISPNGRRAFTANVSTGSVSILDLRKRRLEGVVKAADMVQRITVSPDGRRVYTHDQRQPRIIVIDPNKRAIARTYTLPGLAYVSAATEDGRYLIVGGRPELQSSEQSPPAMYILELATSKVDTVTLPGWPRVIILDEAAQTAWANLGSGEIVRLNLKSRTYDVVARLERGLDGMAAIISRQ